MRAVRAGEAKLCVRVRRASLTLGLGSAGKCRLRAVWGAIVAGKKVWILSTPECVCGPQSLLCISSAAAFSGVPSSPFLRRED